MTRPRRMNEQHGWFHFWNRGVDRQDIFTDDLDREVFVDHLAEAAGRFEVEIHAFSLMTNHFHLVVNCPDGGLSDFAQRFQKRYVEQHNDRVDRTGPVRCSPVVSRRPSSNSRTALRAAMPRTISW